MRIFVDANVIISAILFPKGKQPQHFFMHLTVITLLFRHILASAILSDADILLTGDKDFEELSIDKL